jgi:hypothetical protein
MLGQGAGGALADVIAPPTDAEGGLFSEINDNSVAIMLTYGTALYRATDDHQRSETTHTLSQGFVSC